MTSFIIPIFMVGGMILGGIVGYFGEKTRENKNKSPVYYSDYSELPPTETKKKKSSNLKVPPPLDHQ